MKTVLWEWIQYHEGGGVMPDRISRGDSGKTCFMTAFDPRIPLRGKFKK